MGCNYKDPVLSSMRHKQWTYYHDWYDIFGNDRATGERSTNFESALQQVLSLENEVPTAAFVEDIPTFNLVEAGDDSLSDTHPPGIKKNEGATSKNKKRKHSVDIDHTIVAAINNLADITKHTMGDLIKQIASEDKLTDAQDEVLNALERMTGLSEDEQVLAAKLLFNNDNDLALFQRLGTQGRICLVKRLLGDQ